MARADAGAPLADLVGKTLAQFRVRAKLGQGGMGVVYLATDEKLKRDVALKVLPAGAETSASQRQRFLREARAAAAITHACIAAVYEIGEAEGHAFIAMELVKGVTLRARMAAGLSVAESVRIARDVARGLAKAHERGVVHRDLKPDNVMLTDEGDVKILDFGIAKMWEPGGAGDAFADTAAPETGGPVTAHGHVMGTPAYMSPEQARGEAADARSDVFSFGAMLYEMLCGARPFQGEIGIAVLYAVIHTEPAKLDAVNPAVPSALAALVTKCLAKERDTRFASGRELAAALDTQVGLVASGEPRSGDLRTSESRASSKSSIAPDVVVRPSGGALVSGEGTELAATVTPEAIAGGNTPPAEPASRTRAEGAGAASAAIDEARSSTTLSENTRSAPARKLPAQLVAVALLLLLGIPVGLGLDKRMTERAAGAPASDTDAGPATLMTTAPLPSSTSAEALAAYRKGVQAFHDADVGRGQQELDTSVRLDPSLGAPSVRLCAFDGRARRPFCVAARQLRGALSARDAEILDVVDPLMTTDVATAAARAVALADAHPRDAEIALIAYDALSAAERKADAKAMLARTVSLDPSFALAYLHAGVDADDREEARTLFEKCLSVAPGSGSCIRRVRELRAYEGDCVEVERLTQRNLVVEPESAYALGNFLDARMAVGDPRDLCAAPIERMYSVAKAEAKDTPPEELVSWRRYLEVDVGIHYGDFAPAIAYFRKEKNPDRLVLLASEVGDQRSLLEAARAAMSDVMPATWIYQYDPLPLVLAVRAIRAADHLSPKEARALIAPTVSDVNRLMATPSAKNGGRGSPLLLALSAALAETPQEFREVLGHKTPDGWQDVTNFNTVVVLGDAALRAGSFDLAIQLLTPRARTCSVFNPTLLVDYLFTRPLARLDLGLALAAKGDVAGACEWLGQVVAQWGKATPRSTTAEKARAKMSELHCQPR